VKADAGPRPRLVMVEYVFAGREASRESLLNNTLINFNKDFLIKVKLQFNPAKMQVKLQIIYVKCNYLLLQSSQ